MMRHVIQSIPASDRIKIVDDTLSFRCKNTWRTIKLPNVPITLNTDSIHKDGIKNGSEVNSSSVMKVSSISKDGYETLLLLAGPPSSDKISIAMASVQMDTKYWRRNTMIFKMFFFICYCFPSVKDYYFCIFLARLVKEWLILS